MVESQLSDDLTSIASDLETGLRHYREGDVEEALWWWQFSYVSSWGNLAGVSLNALLSVVSHDRLDAEFTGEDEDVAAADEMLDEGEPAASPVNFTVGRDRSTLGTHRGQVVGIVVQKYGGSSVADAAGIKRVAQRIVNTRKAGHDVVVVVSAMGDTTDELRDLAEQVTPLPPPRELDMLLTAGERISMALVAMAIAQLGHTAKSFTGSQAGVITDSAHGRAKIIDITPGRIEAAIGDGAIAIVAGFQGVSQDTKDITTLGRGASDTTAVALAAALGAEVCEIYTDVDGVFTADPRIVPTARKLDRVSTEEMLEMAASGAKILHLRCVEYARRYHMPIHVRSSFSQKEGTWIVPDHRARRRPPWNRPSSPASPTTGARPRSPWSACPTRSARPPASSRRWPRSRSTSTWSSRTSRRPPPASPTSRSRCPAPTATPRWRALAKIQDEVGYEKLLYDDQIGKVSLIGAGMRSHPGITARFFSALAAAGVNIEMISTSEIRISVIVDEGQVDDAVRATHSAFDLDADEVEAVVYGGTGR